MQVRRTAARHGIGNWLRQRCALVLGLAVLVTLWPASPALAVTTHSDIFGNYNHTAWSVRDGAPADIWALAQSRDGYLWLGTGSGLYRFDGIQFDPIPAPPGQSFVSNNVTALHLDDDGSVWIGYFAAGMSLLRNGQLRHFGPEDGMPDGAVVRFARDRHGALWVANSDGLVRIVNDRLQRIGEDWNFHGGRAYWVLIDHHGTLWVAGNSSIQKLPDGARQFVDTGVAVGSYAVLGEAPDGRIWVSDDEHGTRPIDGSMPFQALPTTKRMLFDEDGALWATASLQGGLIRYHAGQPLGHFAEPEGLTANVAVPVLEDRQGNIWVGTNLGLNRFRRQDLAMVRLPDGSNPRNIAVTSTQDGLEIYMPGQRLRVDRSGTHLDPVSLPRVLGVKVDQQGVMWAAGLNHPWRVDGEQIDAIPAPPEFGWSDGRTMAVDNHGGLWLSTQGSGLWHWDGHDWNAWQAVGADSGEPLPGTQALQLRSPSTVVPLPGGEFWLGYPDNLIAHVISGKVSVFDHAAGLNVGGVAVIVPRADGALIGGESGIARLRNGKIRSLDASRVNEFRGVSGIVRDGSGDLFINGSRGIVRINEAELDRGFDETPPHLAYRVFDDLDGLEGVALQAQLSPTAGISGDGRLWFATNRGVALIDPQRLTHDRNPVPVQIRSISANEQPYPVSSGLSLPPNTSSLRIDYTALDLAMPERVRFRYRLDGVDTDWQEAGHRRQAYYSNLGPGHYRFEVIAANRDGVWSTPTAALDFRIRPRFTQTHWFTALLVLLVLALLTLGYMMRVRQLALRMRLRLEERHAERERIARDLHDTLLQGTQGLILRVHAISEQLPDDSELRQALNLTLDRAANLLEEGRDRVQALRVTQTTDGELGAQLEAFANAMSTPDGPELVTLMSGTPRPLLADAADELLLIAQEALSNAFRHARAGRIELRVDYQTRRLILEFCDDGIGFDHDLTNHGQQRHWGLTGMRERAEHLGADLTILSRVGEGTRILLKLAAHRVYAPGTPQD